MSKDYKHCIQQAQKQNQKPAVAGWQWLSAVVLIIGFVGFLLFLRGKASQAPAVPSVVGAAQAPKPAEIAKKAVPATAQAETQPLKESAPKDPPAPVEKPKPAKPRFQFYTVLPEKEVIIPEAEIKARKQEEKQGKAPPAGDMYVLQIGSFKTYGEADRLKAQLAMLGVEAKIEVAQIGTATWNRVKVGPFISIASADKIRYQLRQSNVDSVVQKTAALPLLQAPTATLNAPATP